MSGSRFERELEFVQLLCNPEYLRWLAHEGYFESEEFRSYLRYLEYWRRPEYSRFLSYPQCLAILERLNNGNVNDIMNNESLFSALGEQQYFIWLNKHREDWNKQ
ncbi:Rad5p-binding protein [Encephalitozoon romaleae SJ-2008]|uniref:Mediator of RNA polymerase II transcription subunit 31 n=1 Tax=Encephalitozoon romaleae (strain SJ-2008) TaxID=1178016 RepID=I7AU44_ENCRO|nr:Rad5p-binding protein [Encephalitozoon romaleae SJ-2008]AFN84002.1 Rad5p-binding protein [Encephalitozoon romaleae SJ-2008]